METPAAMAKLPLPLDHQPWSRPPPERCGRPHRDHRRLSGREHPLYVAKVALKHRADTECMAALKGGEGPPTDWSLTPTPTYNASPVYYDRVPEDDVKDGSPLGIPPSPRDPHVPVDGIVVIILMNG